MLARINGSKLAGAEQSHTSGRGGGLVSLAHPKLARALVKSTTIWPLSRIGFLSTTSDRDCRGAAVRNAQGKYSAPAGFYETKSLLAAKRCRGRARRTLVRV